MGTLNTGTGALRQPIPTRYAGCHFRSRLEARWAVFFDALDIPWEYEHEGYEYEGWRYLPDFYLPTIGCYVEVKGDASKVTDDYLTMLGHVGHFLPGVHSARGTTRGLVLLGSIPRPADRSSGCPGWSHCHLSHWKGLQIQSLWWAKGGADVFDRDIPFDVPGADASSRQMWMDNVDEYALPRSPHARHLWDPYPWFLAANAVNAVNAAYAAARSARFEYGESGPT